VTAIHQDLLRDLLADGPDNPRARIAGTLERLASDTVAVLLRLADSNSPHGDEGPRSQLLSPKLQSHVGTEILCDLGMGLVRPA
jgi:hypothetical protein